ncbi:type II secretion system F family protein [Vulcanococcus limneticus]|uniref:type II secretion system F family protein n=1 Tax=Vulcanococcus limneticus TaxID=2170428 RepID=UPI00398BBC9D
MTTFLVTYATRSGRMREMTLEASSPAEARRGLRSRGILPTTLVRKESNKPVLTNKPAQGIEWGSLFESKISVKEKALFANKLSALVDAGVPIMRSLDLMHRQQKSALFRRALSSMTAEVNQGSSLGSAMRRWPKVFDNLSIAMVEAGEAGGVLDETLKRLAKLLEENARLQNQLKAAMGYPITVLVIAILVFLGMTIFLIPTFAEIFDQLGAELPVFTQMMINLSKLLRSTFSIFLVGGIILAIYAFTRYYATPVGRRQVDGIFLKLPLFGDLLQKTASAQFCRTMSSLSKAGVPIMMSLEILHDTTNNAVVGDAIKNSRNDISEGVPLSTALALKRVFPEMMVSMLAIGEETGEMDTMLSKVADFYEDEVSTAVKTLTSLIEPVMIVLVGGIVGSILLAMYMPMFSVFEHIR